MIGNHGNLEGQYVQPQGAHLIAAHFEGAALTNAHLEGTDLRAIHLEGASLRGANLKNVRWPTNYGDYPVILPDATVWRPEETKRLGRFTYENHLDYKATLVKINAICVKLGCDPIK